MAREAVRRFLARRALAALSLALAALCASCSSAPATPSLDEYLTIVTKLGSYNERERRDAVRTLRSHPAEPTKAALRSILKGEIEGEWSDRVRVTIAAILATWHEGQGGSIDTTGLPELVEALRGADAQLRRIAEETLPLFGATAVPYVKDVLRSGQQANRVQAAVALGRMLQENQEPEAGRALLGVNLKDEASAEVRMAIVINLAEWKDTQAVGGLVEALTDPDEGVRVFAWEELKRRAKPPLEFNPREADAARAEAVRKLRAWCRDQSRA